MPNPDLLSRHKAALVTETRCWYLALNLRRGTRARRDADEALDRATDAREGLDQELADERSAAPAA